MAAHTSNCAAHFSSSNADIHGGITDIVWCRSLQHRVLPMAAAMSARVKAKQQEKEELAAMLSKVVSLELINISGICGIWWLIVQSLPVS